MKTSFKTILGYVGLGAVLAAGLRDEAKAQNTLSFNIGYNNSAYTTPASPGETLTLNTLRTRANVIFNGENGAGIHPHMTGEFDYLYGVRSNKATTPNSFYYSFAAQRYYYTARVGAGFTAHTDPDPDNRFYGKAAAEITVPVRRNTAEGWMAQIHAQGNLRLGKVFALFAAASSGVGLNRADPQARVRPLYQTQYSAGVNATF